MNNILAINPFQIIPAGVEADFYVITSGKEAGKPVKEKPTSETYFGIRCNPEVLNAQYFFYMVTAMHNANMFPLHSNRSPRLEQKVFIETISRHFWERSQSRN